MSDERDTVRVHMDSRTDDELRSIVTVDAGDYRQEAVDMAWAELRRRGITEVGERDDAAVLERDTNAIPTRWLTFYTFMLPVGAASALLSAMLTLRPTTILAALVGVAAPACLLAWGLRRRLLWAFKLNWFFLAFDVVAPSMDAASPTRIAVRLALIATLWGLPNYSYFSKRRDLFS